MAWVSYIRFSITCCVTQTSCTQFTLSFGLLWFGTGPVAHTHYDDVAMGAIASQITSLTIVYSNVYSDADQRKHQSSASLAFVRGIHRGPVNSPHKWPVTRKMFSFDVVIIPYGSFHWYCDSLIITQSQWSNLEQYGLHHIRHYTLRIWTQKTNRRENRDNILCVLLYGSAMDMTINSVDYLYGPFY